MVKEEIRMAGALEMGREAFGRQAWAEAYTLLSAADDAAPLGVDDLELLATSAYLLGKDEIGDDVFVRAHKECLLSNDVPRAARFAFWLTLGLTIKGESARASGWLGRAQHLLGGEGHDCPERGLLLVLTARIQLKRGDMQAARESARQAAQIGDRFNDPDLKVFSRLIIGQIRVTAGEVAEAAAMFDEVMVAVTIGDVSPIAVGVVYCAVIDALHEIFDIQRAREWTAALSRWCASQPELVPFRGECLVHRAEIMRLSGDWPQALAEAEHASVWLSQLAGQTFASTGATSLPAFKCPVGAAFYELAEIHRVRGDFTKAAESYRQASRYGQSPEPGFALLRLAEGRLQLAEAAMRRVLDQPQNRVRRAPALVACVEIMIAAGDYRTARSAAEELSAFAAEMDAPFLKALSAQSMGVVMLAEGDARAALAMLREAWMAWQEVEAPYHAARVRVQLGLACRALGDDDAAELELDSARRVFERLAAAPDVTRVDTLMKMAARSGVGALTPRELEVIGLVATGKTNRAIARQLSISERTVDRHVSSILMKLELESRSAATAYAYQHGLA
jgi:ATP/maltotriose-dependent transcriptional regulator MalT